VAKVTKDIVGKLRKHLSTRIDTECGVVYLMAEVRKLLARDAPAHDNRALWMYCHWALHVDLESPKTTMEFLRSVDLWITNTVAYLEPSGPWKFMEEVYLFRDFLYLDTFRRELRDFLHHYDLQTALCDDDPQWFDFLSAYSGVIEDGTLSTKTDKNNELGAVKQVTFKKGDALSEDHHVNFVIQWDIELKDGRTIRTEFDALPKHPLRMSSHHIEVLQGGFVPPPLREPK
jgi:hypothetical protein